MESYQTPLKKKMNEIHSQMRSEQLSDITSKARELNRLTSRKQIQNEMFKKLISLLNMDCLNFNILREMKKLHKQNGFVTKQSDAIQLTTVLLKLLKMSESKTKEEGKTNFKQKINKVSYIKSEQKQSAIKMLVGLLGLLTWNAKNYPQIAAYSDEKILQTVLEILRTSTNTKIKNQCLRLTICINQNIATKRYFFSHGLLSTLSSEKYLEHCEIIENLLTDNYNIFYFKAQKHHIDELIVLFDTLKQKIYTQIDNDKILQIHNFIESFTQQLSPQIKQYPKLFKLMFFILRKCENINCNEKINEEWYAKIVENIVNSISNYRNIDNKQQKQCLLRHLQKFWILNEKKVREYKKIVEEIRICEENHSAIGGSNIQELGSQKKSIQSMIDRLMSLFLFIYERISEESQVKIYAQKLFTNIYLQFRKGAQGQISTFQFILLISHYKGFTITDLPNITLWCYRFMDQKTCRNECLKKLSLALKNNKIQYSEFSGLKSYYDQRRVQLDGEINDQLTDFIFNFSEEYRSLQDIERKQKEIKRRKDDWERRQYEEEEKDGKGF